MRIRNFAVVLPALLLQARAAIGTALTPPSVVLDSATFIGKASSTTTQSFLDIPFALPPTGDRRLRLPEPISAYNGTRTVTAMGPACPQKAAELHGLLGVAEEVVDYIASVFKVPSAVAEDCLTLNLIKPTTATAASMLPVVVWIFGGGFESGGPATFDCVPIVERSIDMEQPVISVSMNYRSAAFGFLASKETWGSKTVSEPVTFVERQALRWIQKYITAFGGDPTKGESAGAVSVALQMLANNGDNEGLFRAAFMQSGGPVPVGPLEHGQKYYDAMVQQTGCADAADTLACLRTVPYAKLTAAQDATPSIWGYQSLAGAWFPREDGVFLTDTPLRLVQQGRVANVPFPAGECLRFLYYALYGASGSVDDEGTLFSLTTLNITTDTEFLEWVSAFWLPLASSEKLETMNATYPSDIIVGSPFDTGVLNAVTPQFKRIAAFQGDAVFQAPRRLFQQSLSGRQDQWAFLSKRLKVVPLLGSFHGSDLLNIYFGGELMEYLINFATNLDPNGRTVPHWPAYTLAAPNMMTFLEGLVTTSSITQDTYRTAGMQFLTNLTLQFPI
ncbi:carotenoid ester lipase precursor [Mycena latifolia]|nr:carotenoid ester lipase precursor [Mycena latifolia]